MSHDSSSLNSGKVNTVLEVSLLVLSLAALLYTSLKGIASAVTCRGVWNQISQSLKIYWQLPWCCKFYLFIYLFWVTLTSFSQVPDLFVCYEIKYVINLLTNMYLVTILLKQLRLGLNSFLIHKHINKSNKSKRRSM